MILSAVHEGYLIAAIVICILQFLFYRTRLSALSRRDSDSERARLALQGEIARLQKDREEMEIEANYDPLTGLPNRRNFERRLAAALAAAEPQSQPCALLMIDFDYFKSINDNFGHPAGDDVLKTLAVRLQESLRRSGRPERAVCARYGGDEFSVILPGCGNAEATLFAESLRSEIENLHLEFNGQACPLSISIGVAAFPAHTPASETLFEQADRALYRAKTRGRNRVCEPAGQGDDPAEES